MDMYQDSSLIVQSFTCINIFYNLATYNEEQCQGSASALGVIGHPENNARVCQCVRGDWTPRKQCEGSASALGVIGHPENNARGLPVR